MSFKYFVDEELIPNDGSREILEKFNEKIDKKYTNIYIYPDIHYKKGSRVVNGMVISSSKYIYPACLGVANCGFTVGKVLSNLTTEELQKSFENYSKKLKDYKSYENYSIEFIEDMFKNYLVNDFKKNKFFYKFFRIEDEKSLMKYANSFLTKKLKKLAAQSLGSLGGGNHFFELHKVDEVYEENADFKKDDVIFMLHSDSIGVGDTVNMLYSNLSEMDCIPEPQQKKEKKKMRKKQIKYFFKNGLLFKSPFQLFKLLFSQKDYRGIKAYSGTGKSVIFAHHIASLFGDMNRDIIVENWAKSQNIKYKTLFSHDHDSINIEEYDNEIKFVHRNGVQKAGKDFYFALPSALGIASYIMKNTKNKQALYSSNHGVGRIQDKYIARQNFNEEDTNEVLKNMGVKLYRVGKGNIAEQNFSAFKDAVKVIEVMEKNNLGNKLVRTIPFAAIKG